MPKFHLISHHLCPYVQRAVIVLTEKNIAHKRTYIDLANKPDWFRELSPLGKVPVLEIENAILFESQVIVEYLDEVTAGSLHPADPLEKARHRAWIEFGSQTLNAIGGFYNASGKEAFEKSRSVLSERMKRIEREVSGPWFDGESFQMIDGVWGTIFRYFEVFDQIGNFQIMSGLENVHAWQRNISKRQSVSKAAPEGYHKRLEQFLMGRNSYLSGLMTTVQQPNRSRY